MSGIFKGDSIYKSGGGSGGGYKDGGELVDGDFIRVENNTISSYDNETRNSVNFYFEVKDGDILNSIIEFTTQVNASVNVYILKNGFYFPLGNIGGNTVNAGDDYKINIIGDSYDVEEVNNSNSGPDYAEIDGKILRVYLSASGERLFTQQIPDSPNSFGEYYYNWNQTIEFRNKVSSAGWRFVNAGDDKIDFENSNIPLLNKGYYDKNYGVQYSGNAVLFLNSGSYGYRYTSNSNTYVGTVALGSQNLYATFLLVKDV